MRGVQVLLGRVRAVFRREALEREMEAEMEDHLAREAAELSERGLTAEEARRRAGETMGRLDAIREECRDARGVNGWEHLRQDVAFALRLLQKRRTYTAVAVGTIALGIGATTAVFSVVDTVLMKPLPFAEPQRLILVEGLEMRGPFEAMRTGSRVAEYAGHQGVRAFTLAAPERAVPERVPAVEVSANFFAVLGVRPAVGRVFEENEDRPGRNRVAVLSHGFWLERYGGQPGVVGKKVVLDETAYEIVGVMPVDFRFPPGEARLWIPMLLDPRDVGVYWGTAGTSMFARLKSGATIEDAKRELREAAPRIRAMFPWRMPDAWGVELRVRELGVALAAGIRTRGWMLFGAVALVLAIAVVNVANLMLGQTAARTHELALRASLGATGWRLARQLMTESVVLTASGGALGVLVGYGLLGVLRRLLPADTPRLAEVAMDARVLGFAAAISVLSGIVAGLWPAWKAKRRVAAALAADGGRGATVGTRGLRTDGLLVMTEAALATVLLVGAGLLVRSFLTMLAVDVGVRVDSVVTAELSPNRSAASTSERRAALWSAVRDRLSGYPGVRGVAAMSVLPVTPQISAFAASIEDHPVPEHEPQHVLFSTSVSPEHREVLGIRLLEGRGFTEADHRKSALVAVVSRSTARKFWPGGSAIGKRVKPVYNKEWRTIVGVFDDVKSYSITGPPDWASGEVYLPMAQSMFDASPISLTVRVEGDSRAFEKALAGLVHEVCATCAVSKVARMESVVAKAVEAPRSMAWLLGGFAALAVGLAGAGIYGVVNHGVVRRTKELGVRLALGASPGQVAALVVGASIRNALAGAAVGVGVAWGLSSAIRNLLFGIAPHDPWSYAVGPAVLAMLAVAAGAAPAVRAGRIDPAQSLREG